MQLVLLEIWAYLLVSFLLGMAVQWFFCCRGKYLAQEPSQNSVIGGVTTVETKAESDPIDAEALSDDSRPVSLAQRPDDTDELKRIKGIGTVIEATLNELGIFQFRQIAEWTDENIAWVEHFLAFPGRISRENWVQQAQALAQGDTTDFAKRVDSGDVDY